MDIITLKPIPKDYKDVLVKCGVSPVDMLFSKRTFDVEPHVTPIEVDIPRLPSRSIAVRTQMSALRKVLQAPLGTVGGRGYCLALGSFPTDEMAKWIASEIMYQALVQWREQRRHRAMPIWHRVNGSYRDSLRDEAVSIPSLLVISNVTHESTPMKLEKVRDLLEKFNNVPRIVVCGGNDPATLFSTRLHLRADAVVYLDPIDRVPD